MNAPKLEWFLTFERVQTLVNSAINSGLSTDQVIVLLFDASLTLLGSKLFPRTREMVVPDKAFERLQKEVERPDAPCTDDGWTVQDLVQELKQCFKCKLLSLDDFVGCCCEKPSHLKEHIPKHNASKGNEANPPKPDIKPAPILQQTVITKLEPEAPKPTQELVVPAIRPDAFPRRPSSEDPSPPFPKLPAFSSPQPKRVDPTFELETPPKPKPDAIDYKIQQTDVPKADRADAVSLLQAKPIPQEPPKLRTSEPIARSPTVHPSDTNSILFPSSLRAPDRNSDSPKPQPTLFPAHASSVLDKPLERVHSLQPSILAFDRPSLLNRPLEPTINQPGLFADPKPHPLLAIQTPEKLNIQNSILFPSKPKTPEPVVASPISDTKSILFPSSVQTLDRNIESPKPQPTLFDGPPLFTNPIITPSLIANVLPTSISSPLRAVQDRPVAPTVVAALPQPKEDPKDSKSIVLPNQPVPIANEAIQSPPKQKVDPPQARPLIPPGLSMRPASLLTSQMSPKSTTIHSYIPSSSTSQIPPGLRPQVTQASEPPPFVPEGLRPKPLPIQVPQTGPLPHAERPTNVVQVEQPVPVPSVEQPTNVVPKEPQFPSQEDDFNYPELGKISF